MSKIIHLHSIQIKALTSPHDDLPADMQMFAQLVINGNNFLQTIPVESKASQSSWTLDFECNIPQNSAGFALAILRHSKTAGTRLLGSVGIERKVLEMVGALELVGANASLKMMVSRVNPDGPLLEFSADLSASEDSSTPLSGFNVNDIEKNRITSFETRGIIDDLRSMTIQGPLDPLELWVMYERLLLLPRTNEARAKESWTTAGTVDSLNQAVCAYTDAVRDDPMSAMYLSNLGNALRERSKRLGNLTDLHGAVSKLEAAVGMTPDGHPSKPSWLINLGNCLLRRFEQLGELTDLNEAMSKFEAVVRLIPENHSDQASCLHNVGISLVRCFDQLGDLTDLNEGVSKLKAAVKLIPEGHPDMPSWLNNLGSSLLCCFEQVGDLTDLNESVSTLDAAIRLTPEDHPDMPAQLHNLGRSLLRRFEHLGDFTDFNGAVSKFEAAVGLTPEGHPNTLSWLKILGHASLSRFERLGDLTGLNESVSRFEAAVRLSPEGHPDMPSQLNSLGNSLLCRFQQVGDLTDLNESLSKFEAAVKLIPEDHPDKASCLHNVGRSLVRRFEHLGDLTDLNESVSKFEAAVRLTPEGHPDMPLRLNNLGSSLLCRFDRLRDLSDINESVLKYEAAVRLTPEGHPDKLSRLESLGHALLSRFERFGDLTDLNKSVSKFEAVVRLTPEGHPDMHSRLSNFGYSLLCRFDRLGDLTDLNESVSKFEDVVRLTPEDHSDMPSGLTNLGNSLLGRFERVGNLTDLNESVSKFAAAVGLTPEGHPDMPSQLNNLGNSLCRRFERLGDLTDVNESVSKYEAAVRLTPVGHPALPSRLNNLGNSLCRRFERLGDLTDVNESVSKLKDAVRLTPEDHPNKLSWLKNLGNPLLCRFDRLGDLTDLNESVSTLKAAIRLTPEHHPDMPAQLNNLGMSLFRRVQRLGDLTDLNESVSTLEAAVSLTQKHHPNMPLRLNSLGGSLVCRFQQLGDLTDLNESISKFEAAISLTPDGHPSRCMVLTNLGNSLLLRFMNSHAPQDREEMLIQYSHAASTSTGSTLIRFQAAAKWAEYAHIYQHPSLLRAYTTAIALVPEVAWLGLSISDRHHQLLRAGHIVRGAASAAIDAHEYSKAVEWLEQGRSVIWGQILSLRSPVDDLQMLHPKIAAELVSISNLLETSGTRSGIETDSFRPSQSLHATAREYHDLAARRDELLQQIRGLAGFERFLLPKLLSELSPAAKIGHVVLLNTSTYSCDALILIPGLEDEVMHVPLPDFTLDQAQHLTEALGSLVSGAVRSERLDGGREGALPLDEEFSRILSVLWMKIVKPVLDQLALTNPPSQDLGRIWWCPTGPLAFLPIHAAGLYGKEAAFGSKLSDFFISSYTPSLSALIEGLRAKKDSQDGLQLLAVAQPSAFGQNPIPGTIKEIASIEHLAQGVIPLLKLEQDMATVESVQNGMRKSRWAHFACHGIQDIFTPTNSALLLAGSSKLTLSHIIQLRLPHADLAFLSACQTATGSKSLEDEAVHLTAGMLLAGYRGVIGTMWSIKDNDGPQVATDVYAHLFKMSPPDSTRAAEALHLAVQNLRMSDCAGGTKSFPRWVPFIHVGV
ncbi:TPR-like protein [Mycena latifolia]|nr:TPR-like protein [Mycena latifolia]